MNPFRIIILVFFGAFIVIGALAFAGVLPLPGSGGPAGVTGTVDLWGTIPEEVMREPVAALNDANEDLFRLRYTEFNANGFDTALVEALASGRGPDMVLLPNDLILRHADKVQPIPYESISARTFRDAYVGASEIYLHENGIVALPFTIDPLVLYWNRSIFASAGFAEAPDAWEQFFSLAQNMTERDDVGNITESAVALGTFDNITHAKDIIAGLMIQAGDPIIANGTSPSVVLGGQHGFSTPPAESALRFYTEFSNPSRTVYSWNRALPASKEAFTSGDLASYIGYASERNEIVSRSPNLDFDAALLPQTMGTEGETTFARLTGVAVLRSSDNIRTAFHAAFQLTSRAFIQNLASANGLPPVRRDLLNGSPEDPFQEIFHQSALVARTWLDPRPAETDNIFREMVQDVVSGRADVGAAVDRAAQRLSDLL